MLAEAIALYSDDSLLGDTHEWSRAAAATLAKWRAQNADGQARALAGSQAQLSGVDGVVLSGLPAARFNGLYRPAGAYGGWRHFQHVQDAQVCLFRSVPHAEWYVFSSAEDDEEEGCAVAAEAVNQTYRIGDDACSSKVDTLMACVAAPEGLLPVGQHEWRLLAAGDRTAAESSRTVLVRLQLLSGGGRDDGDGDGGSGQKENYLARKSLRPQQRQRQRQRQARLSPQPQAAVVSV